MKKNKCYYHKKRNAKYSIRTLNMCTDCYINALEFSADMDFVINPIIGLSENAVRALILQRKMKLEKFIKVEHDT